MKDAGFDGFRTKPLNVKQFMQAAADVFSRKGAQK